MGQDFGEPREWSEERELDWSLLEQDNHKYLHNFYRDLLKLYRRRKAFYEADQYGEGFQWINADDRDRSIYSFIRSSKDGKKNLLFVMNFTPVAREDYRVGVPRRKQYKLILNGDEAQYGGSGAPRPTVYKATKQECDGEPYSFAYPLAPYGVAIFEF
jgi:1,4-alpha-glucan branching enzyme